MTDTKICEVCGKEYTRTCKETPVRWAQRKYCSKVCAGSAKRAAPTPMVMQTKTCLHCGASFTRRLGEQASNYNKRVYCSKACARRKARSGDGYAHIFIDPTCECGEPVSCKIWIILGTPKGNRYPARIGVCADCKEMWLEDGATVEMPVIEKPAMRECAEPDFYAPAHVAQWHNRKGARPT